MDTDYFKRVANSARDCLVTRTLRRTGWRVVRIWEHDLAKHPASCAAKIQAVLNAGLRIRLHSVAASVNSGSIVEGPGLVGPAVFRSWTPT
jgi:G:T-mismatch repair DNA endonuclease (very short patch repair protein)